MEVQQEQEKIRLSQFSHGAGCGCKLSPAQLEEVLKHSGQSSKFEGLLVGTEHKDDAAVLDLGDGKALIATADFFMPIVDDPYDFGRIAAVNAINDVYAMGGKPIMALALLGWPISKLPASAAGEVVRGAREVCEIAGIPLAGGHSIDNLEPLFGLSVNGIVNKDDILTNSGAKEEDLLYLTKPIGVGILATALKRAQASSQAIEILTNQLCVPNQLGALLPFAPGVHAVTDVTGFGLAGHLLEMCEASGLSAELEFDRIPLIDMGVLKPLLDAFVIPDNTFRNFSSYGARLSTLSGIQMQILCDPQTSGGLLIAVDHSEQQAFEEFLRMNEMEAGMIGKMISPGEKTIQVV